MMELQIPDQCILGCHVSISGGVDEAPRRAGELNCNTGQIFTSSNRRWNIRELKEGEAERFAQNSKKLSGCMAAHACYLINLAKKEQESWEKSVRTLIDEVLRANELGIPYLVLHPGSHVGSGEETGIERISEGLQKTINQTSGTNVKILLETMAGQGTGLGYRLEQLKEMKNKTNHGSRIQFCLDTCHMHAAGYDLSSRANYEETMESVEEILGFDEIDMIHLNDSKGEHNSRVDRHQHIGEGTIGEEAFQAIMNDDRLENIPKILETPVEEDWKNDYGKNLRKLVDFL